MRPRGAFNEVFNTDKIEPWGYFQTYAKIAGELGPTARICELGVETGESLRMWQALFPLGEVIGVDNNIEAVWPPGTVKVVKNQDDPGLPASVGPCDLIIDDASHSGPATRAAFDILWPCVRPGGYYVIEDWAAALWPEGMQGPHGDSMLRMAEGLLRLLDRRGGEHEFILYRFGQIILKKSAGAKAGKWRRVNEARLAQ